MRLLKQSTAANVMVFLTDSADHVSGKSGLTLTITASKDGAAFSSIGPTVTERGSGWYSVALTTAHTDTLGDLALHVTSAGADPTDLTCRIVAGSLDADVSTRSTYAGADTSGTTTLLSRLTSGRATNLDNLDATISSRLATAGYTAPNNAGITTIIGYVDELESRLTSTRAALLDNLDAAVSSRAATGADMGLTAGAVDAIWDEVLELTHTARQLMRLLASAAGGKASGLDANLPRYRDLADTKNRIAATTDANGNRSAVTLDLN